MSDKGLLHVVAAKLAAFCGHCTLHGLHYWSGQAGRPALVRAVWAGVVVAGLSLCAALGNLIWAKFDKDPTFTVVESAHFPTENVPFAAVAVCDPQVYGPATDNITNILSLRGFNTSQLEVFYQSFMNVKHETFTVDPHVTRMHYILEEMDISYYDLLYELRKPCSELLTECIWRGQPLDCSFMFREVFTVYGYCCQFDINNFKKFADSDMNLSAGVLKLEALDIIVDGTKKYPNGTTGDGHVMLYVFDQEKTLTLLDSPITLQPATYYDVTVDLWLIDASDDVQSLKLESRKCFLDTDGEHAKSYEDCISNLLMKEIVSTCLCLPFDYVSDDVGESYAPCKWQKLSCVYSALKDIQSKMRSIMSKGFGCYQRCDYVQYKTKAEYTKLTRPAGSLKERKELSSVSVHYADNICIKYRREVLYTWDQLLANLGGIFGLCLGGSIISIIEIVWFLFELLATIVRHLLSKRKQDRKISTKDAWLMKPKKMKSEKPTFPFVN